MKVRDNKGGMEWRRSEVDKTEEVEEVRALWIVSFVRLTGVEEDKLEGIGPLVI